MLIPPIPDPSMTPTLFLFIFEEDKFEDVTASSDAINAKAENLSILFIY